MIKKVRSLNTFYRDSDGDINLDQLMESDEIYIRPGNVLFYDDEFMPLLPCYGSPCPIRVVPFFNSKGKVLFIIKVKELNDFLEYFYVEDLSKKERRSNPFLRNDVHYKTEFLLEYSKRIEEGDIPTVYFDC